MLIFLITAQSGRITKTVAEEQTFSAANVYVVLCDPRVNYLVKPSEQMVLSDMKEGESCNWL